ncbi:WAT1-related protein At2g37460-like [Impatiens glandulifera]|uniref:WAT1-related protein At2g37460-like n=1 Tax=Impatiens glandulifera TaxID=253017 RepID=UPI001FB058B3|nr:WAT1-related protein At2g37460-like [Impatiens glandulifera]
MTYQLQIQPKSKLYHRMKPFLAVTFLQFGLAGMDILSKAALNEGMSNYVFVVYRHAIATIVFAPFAFVLEKKVRPKMTWKIFLKLMILSILEPVIDQNLYFLGMKYTTATFAAAMCNVLPAITFVMACIFGLEKIRINSTHSQAKVIGTITTLGGAMLMTLVKGPVLDLVWTRGRTNHHTNGNFVTLRHSIKGSLMITTGCFSWASFMILQAVTLETYPAELSLTAWICLLGTANGSIVALVMERGNPAAWAINWDTKLLAALYSGIVCSGLAYYIQGLIMKDRGPVFVTAFNPLSMVIVAILSSFILAEQMYMGRVLGAVVIVAGLYLVVWGKSKDYKSSSELDEKQINDAGNKMDEVQTHEISIEVFKKQNSEGEKQIPV